MEVLTSSPPTPPFSSTTPAPIASNTVSPKSSRSLLDRRQTAAKLLHHQSSQSSLSSSSAAASPSLLTASGTHAPFLPSPSASLRMSMLAMASSAASAGVVGHGGVTSGQSSSLPFVPLTPIMASPRLTPDLGAAAGSVVAVANGAAGAGGKQTEQQQRADYLNRGRAGGSHYPWYGAASTDGAGRASTMSEHSSTRTTSTGLSEMTNVPRQRSGSSGSTSQAGSGISTTTPGARSSREQPTARLPSSSQHKSKSRRGNRSRSASRTRNASRTRSASISRPTSPRAIDLGTLPPYQPLPPLSLSPDFRRVEADIAEGLRGMTSLPASSSTSFTSSSNSQPHHASITAGTSRSQSQLVSEAGRSGGMPADGYPHGTQPRAFDESASRVSYGYSHPARSSSSPPSFSPLSASSSSSVVPFPPGIPASTPYAHDPRDANTDSAQTRDSPKHRRSPTRHRPRPGSTNEYQEAVLDQHARYRRAYSQSDDALHHLYQQHSTLPPQAQPHTHSESQPRMPSRERRQRMFKRSFDSFTSKTGTGNFVDPIDVTTERRLRKKSGILVDEDVLDGDMDAGCVLGASLSRKGRSRSVKPKMSLTLSLTSERERAGREESVGSGRGRKMFIVGGDADQEGSDAEGENDNEIFVDAEAEFGNDNLEVLEDQGERDSREREERRTARRYHALLELVTTEVGYLQDLRALVSIHLAQLPSLDTPIPSTLSKPSPSTLSISNLGLSRPFPSSRSFLHLPPSSYPQGAGPGPPPSQDTLSPTSATDRHRDAFDGERSRDAEGAALAASQKDGSGPVTSKPIRRPLFSEQDIQLITRNAAELLAMHETFVKMLKYALEPLGLSDLLSGRFEAKKMSSEGKEDVENAVKAVTELFCQQASAFEVYESFCPGHNEATDLIRTVQEQHPVEWDAFEQRCSLRVSHAFDQQGTPSMDSLRGSLKSKRRHSLSSLAMPMTLSPFGAVALTPVPLSATGPAKSDTLANRHKRKGSGDVPPSSATTPGNSNSQVGRLKFLDYLIKPVQRICKYPLLLDQLKLKRSEADASQLWDEDPVEAASSAMRRVVALVDRASEKRAHAIKSNLIASRLLADCPASPTSPVHVTVDDRRTQLSAEFMQSLGACMLAGALDVVYYQSNGSCRAKYLATFLYVGGYLVLAKVPKGGKAYEAKHWFPVAGFEIVDQEDDEALPYAFHLCSPTAQIHFAASCQLEKTIWMTAIQESLAIMPSAWVNEPTINLPTDIRPLVFAAPEDVIGSEWAATPLPTIQSMSELETPAESSNGPAPPTSSPRKIPKTIARAESLIIQQNHDLVKLSRRTSTTSVKAFFAPLTFDSRVTRPSGQIRQQVDNGLHDVLSDTFVAVRSQVLMRDEELFQLRKKPGNVSRSNSALSISGAFNTRRRRDSATLTSRRKSSIDGPDFTTDPDAAAKATNLMLARRSKSSSAKLKRQRLSLLPSSAPPLPNKMDSDENMPVVERSQSPSPLTRGPSAASSNTNSILPSPVELTMPLPTPGSRYSRSPDSRRAERPKRTTSMVDNFKYFFQSRSTSPTPSYQRSPQVSVVNLDVEPETHGGLIQWWRRGSIRRRAQSYPEATTDDSAPVTPAASSDDSSHAELKAITDRDLLTASPTMLSADGRHRHVSFSQNRTTLARRRSLFASTTFASTTRLDQPSSLGTSNMPQIHRSKTLKNLFSFQRSPSHSGELSQQPT